MIKIHVEKLIVAERGKKFVTFMESKICIAEFRTARHWPLFWAKWIQSIPSLAISRRSTLYYRTSSCNSSLYFRFSDRNFVCPTCLILLDLIILTMCGEAHNYQSPQYEASCVLLLVPLWSTHSTQHPVLNHLWEPPTLSQASANLRVADAIC
jgi:hypothetical protein